MKMRFDRQWIFLTLLIPWVAHAEETPNSFNLPLIADISSHAIEIHASFSGTELLLYGARNTAGDLIILVRGPLADIRLRRKEKIAGMWMNVESRRFSNLPLYYALTSTKPVNKLLNAAERRHLGIGSTTVIATAAGGEGNFNQPLEQQLNQRGWYISAAPIRYFAETLFKTTIPFPDSLARGSYTAEVYLVREGTILSSQTIPLSAFKTGIDAWIFDMAHERPWLYGLAAVFLAIASGWFAHRIMGSPRR
jgi:uncharacterized protein (TIGR02186 family)